MKDASRRVQRAREELARGRVASARREAAAVLAGAAGAMVAQAHLVLAACDQRERKPDGALRHAHAAVAADPLDPGARYIMAEALEAGGDVAAATASVAEAVRLAPAFAQGWFYLGILEGEQGHHGAAAQAFEAVVRIDPRHARAWNNLGNARRGLGLLPAAQAAFQRAVDTKPDYWLALANLAKILRDTGEVERAEALLREGLAHPAAQPPYRPLIVLLAGLTRERGLFDEAAQLYWRAIQAAPQTSSGEWYNLGWVLGERGDPTQAREAFRRSHALDRRELRGLCGQHLALPMIHESREVLVASRNGYGAGLAALDGAMEAAVVGLAANDVLDGLRWTNFFLAYQGEDDRDLQRRYADIVARAIERAAAPWREPITREPVRGRRIRIGFASAFLHVGTVGRYFQSWITSLPRERFEVFAYHLWPGMDAVAQTIAARADTFRTFGGSEARPSRVAPQVRGDHLDMLVYPELGMDASTFALAALRLAPRQYCAWGHPVTTGHATIDAFLSCATMEPDGAPAHYTESLVLLPGIGTSYPRPDDVPHAAVTRSELGLPEDRVLLLCPQSLFKIHPDNDLLFADVLGAHPDVMLILFAGRHPAITDQFMQRLARTLRSRGVEARERVRVLPSLPHPEFMRVNRACDAMVDTLHWSGGNTSLDALASGLPIVTLPGAFMRGRQSAAMLRLIGMEELVARDRDDYLAIVARLVSDRSWRASLRARIEAAQHRLFGRDDAMDALHAFFEREANR
ncbi:MAG: tetratricopeptide repeat protein [Casimicrobiaceae bacterium]